MDAQVGRLLAALDESGRVNNTIVVLWSDHGWHLGEKEITGKNTLWERSTRVPLIFAGPGVSKGEVCQRPVELLDIFPTLLEITAARPPRQRLDGKSLASLLRDPSSKLERDAIFHHFPGYLGLGRDVWRTTPVSVVQAGDWKLLEYLEDGRLELYDLAADVGETRNRAADEPERAAELRRRLATWRTSVGAAMPEARPASAPGRRSGDRPQQERPAAGSTPGR
jgi:arylsulfatase A-like enzyme